MFLATDSKVKYELKNFFIIVVRIITYYRFCIADLQVSFSCDLSSLYCPGKLRTKINLNLNLPKINFFTRFLSNLKI